MYGNIFIKKENVRVRPLPFVKDIFDAAYNNTKTKYIIYTNADIAVYENFYEVNNFIFLILSRGQNPRIFGIFCATKKKLSDKIAIMKK